MRSLRAEIPEWDLRWPYAPAVRARNGISYLTARRFSAQNRLAALRALKRLKASATDPETGLAAVEIVLLWMLLTGNPGGWTVTNIAAGRSGGNSFLSTPRRGRRRAADARVPAGVARPADQGCFTAERV